MTEAAFWDDVLTSRNPAYGEPTGDDVIRLQDELHTAVRTFAHAVSTRIAEYRAQGAEVPQTVEFAPDLALSHLYACHQAERMIKELIQETGHRAGVSGATYAQLGAACGITKQAARLRWPTSTRRTDGGDPMAFELAGGTAHVSEREEGGFVWEATGADGTAGSSLAPYGRQAEAAAHAGSFLALHATDQLPSEG